MLAHYRQAGAGYRGADVPAIFDSRAMPSRCGKIELAGSRVERIESLLEDSDQARIHDAVNLNSRMRPRIIWQSEAWSAAGG